MLRHASPDPPDEDPRPALMTPRRLAAELERVYLELSRCAGRLQGIGCYLDSHVPDEQAELVAQVVKELSRLRGRVLTGETAIAAALDEESWRERRPLLATIEDRQSVTDQAGVTDVATPATAKPPAKSPRRPVERSAGDRSASGTTKAPRS